MITSGVAFAMTGNWIASLVSLTRNDEERNAITINNIYNDDTFYCHYEGLNKSEVKYNGIYINIF